MRLALCLEQTLGHRTHANNLTNALSELGTDVDILRVEYRERGRIPWAFDASWRTARMLRGVSVPDVRLYHTQSISLFAPFVARGRPFVVSVDATPRQVDEMGRWYNHEVSAGPLEQLKSRWYRSIFRRAAAIVAWSNWAADSLVAEYGVPRERITVVHPGAPADFFTIERFERAGRKPTMLFVGGDLRRKGGDLLLEVFERVRDCVDLIMVTPDTVEPRPGLEVVSDATPGSERLRDAFLRSDFFCLPTRGDCTPLVLGEAMAAGLPVITTGLGSNPETVRNGIDGLLINPGDTFALAQAIEQLANNAGLRQAMGAASRSAAREHLDSQKNARKILALLQAVAE